MPFILRRALRVTLSVWLVLTGLFFLMRMAGDPVLAILGPDEFSQEVLDIFRANLGIDKPVIEQYFSYISGIFHGDFGRSFLERRPALDIVLMRLPKTIWLMLASLSITLVIGILAGILAALRHNQTTDTVVSLFATVFYAVPNFVLGIVLTLVFAVKLNWLPVGGSNSLESVILPALTFGASGAAIFARFARSAMLESLRQPYITAAKARGLSWRRIVFAHALPNAALPLLTLLGFAVAGLVSGSVVVETIFAWPGVGRLLSYSVGSRDLPVVQVVVVFAMAVMVFTNMAIDLLYSIADPRIRFQKGAA